MPVVHSSASLSQKRAEGRQEGKQESCYSKWLWCKSLCPRPPKHGWADQLPCSSFPLSSQRRDGGGTSWPGLASAGWRSRNPRGCCTARSASRSPARTWWSTAREEGEMTETQGCFLTYTPPHPTLEAGVLHLGYSLNLPAELQKLTSTGAPATNNLNGWG